MGNLGQFQKEWGEEVGGEEEKEEVKDSASASLGCLLCSVFSYVNS